LPPKYPSKIVFGHRAVFDDCIDDSRFDTLGGQQQRSSAEQGDPCQFDLVEQPRRVDSVTEQRGRNEMGRQQFANDPIGFQQGGDIPEYLPKKSGLRKTAARLYDEFSSDEGKGRLVLFTNFFVLRLVFSASFIIYGLRRLRIEYMTFTWCNT